MHARYRSEKIKYKHGALALIFSISKKMLSYVIFQTLHPKYIVPYLAAMM